MGTVRGHYYNFTNNNYSQPWNNTFLFKSNPFWFTLYLGCHIVYTYSFLSQTWEVKFILSNAQAQFCLVMFNLVPKIKHQNIHEFS